ncbi:MAG TPA: cupredoxin domain-containing protein [Candidatus Limnocylindrales bacterium]|nr:cupredoxin domain-containing protein [Candidatus Limnocylindrales bacterium]
MRRFTYLFLITLAVAALAACGGAATTPAASVAASAPAGTPAASDAGAACAEAPAGASPAVTVEIRDFSYDPDPVTAAVGDVVAWTNADSAPHTASLSDGSCGTESLAQGATGALVFNAPGAYEYQCNIHPGQMSGFTIEVQ